MCCTDLYTLPWHGTESSGTFAFSLESVPLAPSLSLMLSAGLDRVMRKKIGPSMVVLSGWDKTLLVF